MKFFYVFIGAALLGGAFLWYRSTIPRTDIERQVATEVVENSNEGSEIATDNVETKIFTIHAANLKFDVDNITVKEGDTVTINLTSDDGMHDWVLDEFSAATDKVQAGNEASVTFVASKSGTYEYYCSVGSHRAMGMVGKLIVEAK